MKLGPFPHPDLHPLARLRAWHRILLGAMTGIAAAASYSGGSWEVRALVGWLVGTLVYLGVVVWGVGRLDAAQTRRRASSFDPGTGALYGLLVATAFVSLIGVLLVIDAARTLTGAARWGHIALALATLVATWLLIQTVFALRYARRYYSGDAGGLAFPGGAAPTYLDFAYFSAVIGMTSQVSDVVITAPAMRRLALVHGVVAFGFNLLVLALTLNLVASAL